MKNKLAILGGSKVIEQKFPRYNSLDDDELQAVIDVMKGGVLSKYIGAWHEDFYGGHRIKELESYISELFNVKYAISVNSWTSGLISAVGALDIEPGDEIIVTPWTMSASAMAILHWNAIPVFADIDPQTFNIDTESIKANITEKTKAIMSVDIFGQSADVERINTIAEENNLYVISDTAQSPYAKYKGNFAGTLTDIGGFSLNYHKHIHSGEGGIIVTNNSDYAERMQLIRNHAESVVEGKGVNSINNLIGYNFRMGELEAAISLSQFKKLPDIAYNRTKLGLQLTDQLSGLEGLKTPYIQEGNTHVFYVYPLVIDIDELGISRSRILEALQAEGLPGLMAGYQNIHLLPIFQNKIAYGKNNFPWSLSSRNIIYDKGICPVAEELHQQSFIGINFCMYELNDDNVELIAKVFKKVWSNIDELKQNAS